MLDDELRSALRQRRREGRYRERLLLDSPQQTQVTINGRHYLSFCSNDYLGPGRPP